MAAPGEQFLMGAAFDQLAFHHHAYEMRTHRNA